MTKPKDPKDYKKRGAPEWPYDEVFGQKICDAVAISTDSVAQMLVKNPDFPSEDTIRKWRLRIPSFGGMYARAKQLQAELLAEEVLAIADDGSKDSYTDDEGNEKCDNEWMQRSRLRIDTRKWIACKLAPKLYGDKQTIEQHTFTHEDGLKDLA